MTPPIISIHYEQMTQIAKLLSKQEEQISQFIQKFQTQVETLRQGWIGMGAEKFFDEMETDFLPRLKRLSLALDESQRGVNTIIETFAQAEEQASGAFRDLISSVMLGKVSASDLNKGAQQGSDPRPDINDLFEQFRNNRPSYDHNETVGYPRNPIERWLAEQAGLYRRDITRLEADLMDELRFWRGLVGMNTLNDIHDEAFASESTVFGNTGNANNDGLGDAYRHAYWSARMTQEFGADWTQRFTDAHETKPGNQTARDFMDRHNNALGIRIAQQYPNATPEQMQNLIAQAIQNGEGVYIPGADQYPVNSPERNAIAESGPVAYTDQNPNSATIPVDPNQIPAPGGNASGPG
ncbi:MAG: WXG100 family type VII secretion target [Anaerolineae bacterium]|jgi:WXG100 family type VII secretion target|nr:WXG100 family type VII secretion target [Anaerolineae bacterium]